MPLAWECKVDPVRFEAHFGAGLEQLPDLVEAANTHNHTLTLTAAPSPYACRPRRLPLLDS